MDLASLTTFTCNANYSISSVTFDGSGLLTVTVDYSTDLEGLPSSMTLAFDSSIIRSPNITVSFDAVSKTLPLVIVKYQEELKTIRTIFTILSYISVGFFLLSLGHKMIGVEVLTNIQLIYLSNAFCRNFYFSFN